MRFRTPESFNTYQNIIENSAGTTLNKVVTDPSGKRRRFWIDFNHPGTGFLGQQGYHGRWLNGRGRPNDQQDITSRHELMGARQMLRRNHFAEKNTVGSINAAAGTSRRNPGKINRPGLAATSAILAALPGKGAVKLDHVKASGGLVQPVYVLRDHRLQVSPLLQPGQSRVPGIGSSLREHLLHTLDEKLPDLFRIATKGIDVRDLHRIHFFPQPPRPPKRGDTAFYGNTGAGQGHHVARLHQRFGGLLDQCVSIGVTHLTRGFRLR